MKTRKRCWVAAAALATAGIAPATTPPTPITPGGLGAGPAVVAPENVFGGASSVGASAPGPAGLALLGAGMGLLVAMRRRLG
ncbi:hypothetical protein [Botrimarina sp.]|uniref:hypothetical protein n=1 Tax=Botrimarina sp. TaxID=2795802 RepID=UPI0032EC7C1B